MTEFNQDIYVFLQKSSKESIGDFIKFYLENADNILDLSEDCSITDSFQIYECESYVKDHNSSMNMIKPQFSFLFGRYNLSILIDFSNSMFTTTNDGDVKMEKAMEILKEFLFLSIKNYNFNNKNESYAPEIIVNVMCINSNKLSVIVKGWKLLKSNINDFFPLIFNALYQEMSNDKDIVSGDTIFTMIREGIISLNLFEEDNKTLKHLLLITDGNFPIDDGMLLDRCVTLLRHCIICCSFIHIKTNGDFLSLTDQSNDDQLKFIANVTGGFYKSTKELSTNMDRYILRYRYFDQSNYFDADCIPFKNFTDRTFNIPPLNLIFTMINMGYILNSVNSLRDSRVEIELVLQWRSEVYFKILIVSRIPLEQQRKSTFSLSIFGQHYYLHNITKIVSYPSVSIDQFLHRFFRGRHLKDIRHSLSNMELFSQFNTKPICCIPNFINNGLKPMLSPTNQPCDKIDKNSKSFFDFWSKALEFTYVTCFHRTRITLLLEHDFPFPDYLSYPDPLSNRYSSIQGRESLVQLSGLINKSFCDFIVKENNTYVKFFTDNNCTKVPNYFCIIKMACHGLEVNMFLHFFIPTPEAIRDSFVTSLINKISVLKFQPRGKQARPRHMSSHQTKNMDHVPPQQRSWEQINCCTLLSCDLQNMLASYNPISYLDPFNRPVRRNKMTLSMTYLHNHCHHFFKIWAINEMFFNNIFESLIKIRLQEGFHIAISDSSSGFINLVKEIQLVNNDQCPYKCFVQYLIYPESHRSRKNSEIQVLIQDDMASFQFGSNVKKVFTEVFIERKYGRMVNADPEVIHWEGLGCDQIPDAINDLDLRSIETFVTFECFKIYPETLEKGLVKPNVCSVLSKSPRFVLHCPLLVSECVDNFLLINSIFMDLLDNNLKLHGFYHIDITKTENACFNKLLASYHDQDQENDDENEGGVEEEVVPLSWNCYYTVKGMYLLVLMVPGTGLDRHFRLPDSSTTYTLPMFLYGMSLKHLTFMVEDRWTLKLPESKQFHFPINYDLNPTFGEPKKTVSEFSTMNEFTNEMDEILGLLEESVVKLDSIYLLTFVGGVHKNLMENNKLHYQDLYDTFSKHCSELSYFEVDATKFINTICSHCNNALRQASATQQLTSLANKESCEVRPEMHMRIIRRIRQMMAKYFKEVPLFPHMLIYCPGNEAEMLTEFGDLDKSEDMVSGAIQTTISDEFHYCRQRSVDNQYMPISDMECMFTDTGSEAKSVSSARINLIQFSLRPLFISINYRLQYENAKRYLKFDNIPTCISDFLVDLRELVDGDIDVSKLRFHLDMIPITYVDEDLSNNQGLTNLGTKASFEDRSLVGEVNSGSKLNATEITKRYLTSTQTQLLDRCKSELIWTLEDEVVNCLKYCPVVVDANIINTVRHHIENTSANKFHKNCVNEIQSKTFDLDFVFGFEKSKKLFQDRFEKVSFGKNDQFIIDKIDGVYCVFQKRKVVSDTNTTVFTLFPDQTFDDMEEICMQSRLRVDSLCITSLQTASDNLKGDYLRRCSSEGKLNDLKYVRKMSESKRESVTLFDKVDSQCGADPAKMCEVNQEYRSGNPYIRQCRHPGAVVSSTCQTSSNQTPKRHRSGEASSIMYTGNYRSETPMLLNDLVSTATSSKGYEGDSSRVSEGEEYDQFSNCPTDPKVSGTLQSDVAPFWLLLQVMESSKQISLFFHHFDTCTLSWEGFCEYCGLIDVVHAKVGECVHQVNQCLLLEQLAQTRVCRDILVQEDPLDSRPSHGNQMFDFDYDYDYDTTNNVDSLKRFDHGTFACPLILKITFKLHPRLKGTADRNSKAIPALRMNLENIVILNRKNMLIFINENTNGIFYSILNEVTRELNSFEVDQLVNNSVLVSEYAGVQDSSITTGPITNMINMIPTATTRMDLNLHQDSFQLKMTENTDNISIKSAPVSTDFQTAPRSSSAPKLRSMDLLELSMHGVDKLSDATVKSIVANIGSKLDSIVLRQLTESISRCSNIWLSKDDLDFLLGVDFQERPQKPKFYFWSLPKLVIDNSLAFCYYLKQNLQSFFICPKMSDMSLYERFNLNKKMVGEVYLYNQWLAHGVANDAIVLLTVQLLSSKTGTSWTICEYSLPEFQDKDDVVLEWLVHENRLIEVDLEDTSHLSDCYLKVSMWMRGHIGLEMIKKRLYNILQYSIQDLLIEFVIIPRPILTQHDNTSSLQLSEAHVPKSDLESLELPSFDDLGNGVLQRLFVDDLFTWFPELSKSENPLIKYRRTDMFSDWNVEFLVSDVVEGMADAISFNAFTLKNECWVSWNTKHPQSGKEYPGQKKSFILIGRMEELWKKFVQKRPTYSVDSSDLNLSFSQGSHTSTSSGSTCPRKVRMLLKQQPFENNCLSLSMNSSTSTLHSTAALTQNLPELCHVQVQNSVIIPRQMLCIVKIMGRQIDTISYNLVKDTLDNLNNLMDNIVQNHKDRFQMLNSFLYQKLGLFHEVTNKNCLPSLNINVVKTLSQISKVKNANMNINDVTRDRKPSGSPRSFSPSSRTNIPNNSIIQNKLTVKSQPIKRTQLHINFTRLYQDPYTIFSLTDLKKVESINDVIYQYACQYINTYNLEIKRRLLNKKVRQCITFFQPKTTFLQSDTSDIICPLEQLDVFSSMKRACRIFHSVVCPILFIPYVRKRLLDLSMKRSTSVSINEHEECTFSEEWMNVMSIKLLGCYANYVQKEQGFQFVNPPRPNVSQNPCSYALFQKLINNSGIYLMEIFILKGCLCVRLSAFEYRRFSGWTPGLTPFFNSFQPSSQQPQKIFVKDACKLCDLTHLYSFIYDFYVGMVVKSVTNSEENKKYFNVISFLRDFVKMYSYPPMFACNHIYWMPYKVSNDLIKPNDLFEFLIRHYEDYGFMISQTVSYQSNTDSNELFIYNVCDEPLSSQNMMDLKRSISPSSSPLTLPQNAPNFEERSHHSNLDSEFTSIFCLTKSTANMNSTFDLFIVTFNRTNCFPYQHLVQIKKQEPTENVLYPAKYLSILPHKSSSPDNMLHLKYCPISFNSIDTDQLPHSLAWKTFDNRSVIPLQVPLFLTLRYRIENYVSTCELNLGRAITDCHKDSLWQRMYQKPDSNNISLQFKEFQDLINSGDIVDILELDPRLIDSMKIATSYLKELDRCMSLLSEDCCTILYENTSSIYHASSNETMSTHLVLMSKSTTDGFLLLSKIQGTGDEDHKVELKAVFRSQDCRNRVSPQIRYFSSSLRDVTVMLAETAAFCIWRKLTGKL